MQGQQGLKYIVFIAVRWNLHNPKYNGIYLPGTSQSSSLPRKTLQQPPGLCEIKSIRTFQFNSRSTVTITSVVAGERPLNIGEEVVLLWNQSIQFNAMVIFIKSEGPERLLKYMVIFTIMITDNICLVMLQSFNIFNN